MISEEFLFLYGTLRKKMAIDMYRVVDKNCEYIANGIFQGKLYEIDGYPGAIQSDNVKDVVHGELYRIQKNSKVLIYIDEYEECSENYPKPHEYIRTKKYIKVKEEYKVLAWVYLYNYGTSKYQRIDSGDYLDFADRLIVKKTVC